MKACAPQALHPKRALARQVTITAVGATGKRKPPSYSELTFFLSHPGRAETVSETGKRRIFTHLRRRTSHSYDVNTGKTIVQVGMSCHKRGVRIQMPER